jgi:hypothetical protein
MCQTCGSDLSRWPRDDEHLVADDIFTIIFSGVKDMQQISLSPSCTGFWVQASLSARRLALKHGVHDLGRIAIMTHGLLRLFMALLVLACSGSPNYAEAQAFKKEEKQEQSIGVATMKDDGTIVLRLRAKSPQVGVGEGTLVYPPTHPEYRNILSHIGPIRKGQTVPVKPWPD